MSNNLLDASGQPVRLGREVGRGGEGAVWETQWPGQVAKVYHHAIDVAKADKLAALAGAARPDLLAVAAWPTATLHQAVGGPVVGVMMPLVKGHVELHQLYSPVHRRLHFPDRDWSFLVHVAMNCAAAVETVHDAGHVIGDLNQKGVLVNLQGTVHLIDCDSFQIQAGSRVFRCEVGVPELTPPELQGVNFRSVDRTPNHDRFGLALLIFHLLFMGRHPYRGRFGGTGEMTIERAIAEGRFAFSRRAASYQMRPPPGALELNAIPGPLADLFEAAFAPAGRMSNRPTAAQWRSALSELKVRLTRCRLDASHVFPDALPDCVWCAIETAGGPAFFTSISTSESFDAGFDLIAIWNRIAAVGRPPAPTAFRMPRPPRNVTPVPLPMHTNFEALGRPMTLPRPLKSPLAELPEVPGSFVPEIVADDPVLALEAVPAVPVMPPESFVADVEATYRRPTNRLLRYLFPGSIAYQMALHKARERSEEHLHRWQGLISQATQRRERILSENASRRAAWENTCTRLQSQRLGLSERNARRRTEWESEVRRITALREAYLKQNAAVAEQWRRDSQAYEKSKRDAESHNALIAAAKEARQQELGRRQQRFETLMREMESLPKTWTDEAVTFAEQFDDVFNRMRSARSEYDTLRAAFDAQKTALSQGRQAAQLRDYLRAALVDDADISGVGPARKAKLASYGIETALDVFENDVSLVPDFGGVRTAAVQSWANGVARQFVFDPRQGAPAGELRSLHTAFHARRVALQRELQAGIETLQTITRRGERRLAELETKAADRIGELAQAEADASVT